MPLYEYVCEQDGTVIELLRAASQADDPVQDPTGKQREFKRRHSTFAAKGPSGLSMPITGGGSGCACGKPHGCGGH